MSSLQFIDNDRFLLIIFPISKESKGIESFSVPVLSVDFSEKQFKVPSKYLNVINELCGKLTTMHLTVRAYSVVLELSFKQFLSKLTPDVLNSCLKLCEVTDELKLGVNTKFVIHSKTRDFFVTMLKGGQDGLQFEGIDGTRAMGVIAHFDRMLRELNQRPFDLVPLPILTDENLRKYLIPDSPSSDRRIPLVATQLIPIVEAYTGKVETGLYGVKKDKYFIAFRDDVKISVDKIAKTVRVFVKDSEYSKTLFAEVKKCVEYHYFRFVSVSLEEIDKQLNIVEAVKVVSVSDMPITRDLDALIDRYFGYYTLRNNISNVTCGINVPGSIAVVINQLDKKVTVTYASKFKHHSQLSSRIARIVDKYDFDFVEETSNKI